MKILTLVYAFLAVILFSFLGGFFDLPMPMISTLNFLTVFYFLAYPSVRLLWGSGDIEKIEKFLLKNKRNPFYQLSYGVANGSAKEVDEAVNKTNKSLTHFYNRKQYQLIQAYFYERPEEMEKLLRKMRKTTFTLYYEAARAIIMGDLKKARILIEQNPKPWMREALTAEVLVKENRMNEAVTHAQAAVAMTRGVQRYILLKNWQREGLL